MYLKSLLLTASVLGASIAAPVPHEKPELTTAESRSVKREVTPRHSPEENTAVINSRFATYENEKRDDASKKAVINSRFATYENEKRDDDPKESVINSRFATYEE